MIHPTPLENCTGCNVCRLVCPEECITMIADSEGFCAPIISKEKCIDCGLCEKKCPQNQVFESRVKEELKAFGMRLSDDKKVSSSASGGIFTGLAQMILEQGGSVFGCAYDDNLIARHIGVSEVKDLELLQSSKYVQSDVGNTYCEAKYLLNNGKTILYCGTPCQISGLYSYLGKDINLEKLLTVDLFCHGVPSPLLFQKYLTWLGEKMSGNVIYYNFRSKKPDGWGSGYKAMAKTKSKTRTFNHTHSPYMKAFLNCASLRECCYSCTYAYAVKRPADISIGDYWGVEEEHPEKYDRRGVSAVIISTERGKRYMELAKPLFEVFKTSVEKISRHNTLIGPSIRPEERDVAYNHIYETTTDIFSDLPYKIRISSQIKQYWLILLKKILPLKLFLVLKKIKRYR